MIILKKQILASILAFTIILGGTVVFADSSEEMIDVEGVVDETPATETFSNVISLNLKDLNSYYRKDTLMLPLRKIAEEVLGYNLIWNGEEKSVELQKGAQWTKITIDQNSYFFARVAPFGLSKAPELKNSLTYVPVEFFSEVLKYDISVDKDILNIIDRSQEVKEIIFNGFIKDIEEEGTRVLVLGDGTSEHSNYIWLTKTEESEIANAEGENISFEDLKVGSRVAVTMPEIVALSYPAQGAMVKIEVFEDKSFEVATKEIKDEEKNMIIKYPEIKGIKVKSTEDNLNQKIENFVNSIKENDLYKDLSLNYEITLIDDNKISFIFKGNFKMDGFEEEKYLVKSLNLDLNSTNEINFENYFKQDEVSQEKLNKILDKAAKENNLEEFEAEGVFIYFKEGNVVVYYWPLDDSVEMPVELYIPIKEVENIINHNFGEHPDS